MSARSSPIVKTRTATQRPRVAAFGFFLLSEFKAASAKTIYHLSFHICHFSLLFKSMSWGQDWMSQGQEGQLAPALSFQ